MRIISIHFFIISFLFLACNNTPIQFTWNTQTSGIEGNCRGLSVVNETTAWVSGMQGSYSITTDGGQSWKKGVVPDADSLDFRDVEAFDDKTAYLLAAGPGNKSRIYKTINGGKDWHLQFTNETEEAFYSAFAFWNKEDGIAFSDPVNGRFRILRTVDGGSSWDMLPEAQSPEALEGEYAFAASGTCITVHGKGQVWIGTGGKAARVLLSTDRGDTWQVATTSFVSGESSTGIFSLAFRDSLNGIATGGDYQNPERSQNNVSITSDGGKNWSAVDSENELAYRSCVRYLTEAQLLAVGRTGSDMSFDAGQTWTALDTVGYYVVDFAPNSRVGWAAGSNGRISKINF
ncbi:MAG: WD40/YVTN/BNR-like repeat-containing protein [Calditrichia bacterium]